MAQIDVEEYLNLFKQLESLWDQGLGESEEAEELRDRSDGPWYRMTGEEVAQVRQAAQKAIEEKRGVPLQ